MKADRIASRQEPLRLGGPRRAGRAVLRRVLVLSLPPFLISLGIPCQEDAAAQSTQSTPDAQGSPSPAAPPQRPAVAGVQTGVQESSGRIVQAVEFHGIQALSEETLLFYLGIQIGKPLDEAALNRKIKELWDRSLVDDIRVDAEPAAGPAGTNGVKLTITVKERPILRSVSYDGLKRISKTDIQDKLATQRIRVREGEPMSLGELQRVKTLIEQLYAEKGYRFAQARYTVTDVGPNEKKIAFAVDEGNRVRISDIAFEGNTVYNDLHLRFVMSNTKKSGPITRILKKDIYDPAKLQEDLDKIRKLYKAAGYKNVVLGDPKIEVKALHPEAKTIKDQNRRMFLTIPIEEGERWKFGEVTIDGNKIYSDQALMRAFPHSKGSWLKQKLIDDGVKQVSDLYHNTGYIYAQVEPELVEKPNRVADVVVHVSEGEQFRVGRIEFEGNARTMDKVLRRELRLWEGGLVNIGAIRNSVLKVNQLGYFKLNEEDPVEISTNSEKKQVNLTFKGAEADRTELQFGGGWSELDGFFGQFSIATKNFLGRGEQVGLSYQNGTYRDYFDLSYSIPWFMDKPQSVGVRAFKQFIDYGFDTYNQRLIRNSKGAILTYGRNFKLFQSASISFNRSDYDDETSFVVPTPAPGSPAPGPNDPAPGSTVTTHTRINNSSLRPVWGFDSRDNPFETTQGQKLNVAVEYAGNFLGGDNYFWRPEVSYSLFAPTFNAPVKQVFAINGEVGLIKPYGGHTIPILERFYLGGENSIRGHRFRSIFLRDAKGQPVKDPLTQTILGGDKYEQLNVEYHFILGGPFRLLAFVDSGNVYGEGQSFNLSNLRYTAGAELRVLLPVFGAPLRFIYSHNLNPKPGDSFEAFQFSIGTSF
jgi:outer membrane protein insertion porin family